MKIYKLIHVVFFIFLSCEEINKSLSYVTIDSPKSDAIISGIVTIECSFNNISDIDFVELWIDESYSGISENSNPYSLSWDTSNYEDKEYSITVRLIYENGSYIDSEPLLINLYRTVELFGQYYSVENTTELDLNNNMLVGEFPSKVIKLVNLTTLDLSFNQLSGQIPSDLKNLNDLRILNLTGNQFTGSIPPEIGLLEDLNELKLSMNQLSGIIPNSIMNLENLTNINLSINQIEGSLPENYDNLTYLTFLNLSNNNLTGSIPDELGGLENLKELKLYRNNLSGELPHSMCDLIESNCMVSLYDNQLCPPYPACIENILGEQETSNCN